jgi:hypothetical protein
VNSSYFAYLYIEDGYPFAKNVDIRLRRTIGRATHQAVVVNAFDSRPVVHCCIECCEVLHRDKLGDQSYFRQLPDGSRGPTSAWLRRSRSSASSQQSAKRIEWVLKMHAGKTSGAFALAATTSSAMQSEPFRRAMDWVVETGGRHAFL